MTTTLFPIDVAPRIEVRIGRFAEAHDGLISHAEAEKLGISLRQLRQLRDRGLLVPVHAGVYRCVGAPVTTRQQLRAACWAAPSVVSHRSAWSGWGLDLPVDPVVEVSVTRPHQHGLEGVILHRSLDLAPHHVTEVDGLPTTTIARTLVDLGAVVPWWLVERALEAANARKLVTIAEVAALREELSRSGRRGVGVIGAVLERRGLGEIDSDSVLESAFARLSVDYGIDGLVYQHHLVVAGRDRYIDYALPPLKIAVELMGYDTHSRWSTFADDCIRGNELKLLGWTVLEFTWTDVVRNPGYVARVIREAARLAALDHADAAS